MSANAAGLCNSFRLQWIQAVHNLASGGDVIKAALYAPGSSIGPGTTAYTASGEVPAVSGGYQAGGVTVTNGTSPALSGTTVIWTPSAAISFPSVNLAGGCDCCLLYNSSKSNRAICVITFPSNTTVGSFQINMPANTAGAALVEIN